MTKVASALVLTAVATTIACGGGDSPTSPTPAPSGTISALAQSYLSQLVDVMQANSINRLTIDWTGFRASVFAQAGGAQTVADTYPAIALALRLLGDGHSSYRPVSGSVIFVPTRSCSASGAGRPSLPPTIGYVKVTSFSGGGTAETSAFADALQDTIAQADRDNLAGWVVDLRGNGGGNMWPMIAGVGPVLGEGPLGYFISPTGAESLWEYRAGTALLRGSPLAQVTTPYRLRRERPRVAVLSDNGTASSGEATLIAFRQRPDTRLFGARSCGLSTANSGFPMSDGAVLNLTVAVMADRSRTRYGDSVVPDEPVADPSEAERRALDWLLQ